LFSRPAMMLSKVVLPQPLSPNTQTRSFFSTSSDTSCNTDRVLPFAKKLFEIPFNTNCGWPFNTSSALPLETLILRSTTDCTHYDKQQSCQFRVAFEVREEHDFR